MTRNADPVDQAADTQEQILDAQIKLVASRANKFELAPKGECYFCEETFPEGSDRRFCDADCRDDYERQQRLNR